MKTLSPKDFKIVLGLPPVASKEDRIAIDTEWFGMDKKKLHRPTGEFAGIGCTYDGKTVYVISDKSELRQFFERIEAGVHIYHNAKFDIFHIRRVFPYPQRKRLWDTMLIEQIMYSGYYNDFALADLARRRLGIYMPKEERETFSEAEQTKMTQSQLEYFAADVISTWHIYQSQRAEIDETDLSVWKDIELPFLWVLLGMSGVKLDTEKWIALAEKNKKDAEELQAKYLNPEPPAKKLKKGQLNGLNLASPKQVKEELARQGYKLDDTGEETLKEIQEQCEFAKDVLKFRACSKRASTYGTKFIEDHVESDGKIYGDVYQIGAETGRTSCRAPNLQNQPHEEDYRACFVADEDKSMVIADWSSQEPRIAAFLSQDEALIDILNSGKDIYVMMAKKALDWDIDPKTKEGKEKRKKVKNIILGIFYGMSAYGLAYRIEVTEDEAEEMLHRFFNTFPGVKRYVEEMYDTKEDYVTSVYGRKIWLNKYNTQWQRNAVNAPIQSSAADAMKIAARKFLDDWAGRDFYTKTSLILLVHDEIAVEVPKELANAAKEKLQMAMISTANEMHTGIKASVDIFVGESWAAKK